MRRWYEPRKDTPGIAKDAPKKKGFALFWEILWREFWSLLKLNLLFLISCIPVVTIPAAITAANRITATMVRDRNFFLLSDYWTAFKRDFGKSLLGGVLLLVALCLFGLSTWFYYMLSKTAGALFLILAGCSLCLLLTAYATALYFFPMLAMVDLPAFQLLKNSCIMAYTCFKRTVPAVLLTLLVCFLSIGLLPYSLVFVAFVAFSLNNLISNFFIVRPIEEKVLGIVPEETTSSAGENTAQEEPLISATPEEFPEWEEEEGDN